MSNIESRVADLKLVRIFDKFHQQIAIALCSVIIRVLTVSCRVKSRAYRLALGEILYYLNTVYLNSIIKFIIVPSESLATDRQYS